MNSRTWPYGTKYPVRVLEVHRPGHSVVLFCVTAELPGEGFIVADGPNSYPGIYAQDSGEITFMKGGPTGGFWKFEKIG